MIWSAAAALPLQHGSLPAAVFDPAVYALRRGYLFPKHDTSRPARPRLAALYTVRAAVFFAGATSGFYGMLQIVPRSKAGGAHVKAYAHHLAALYQVMMERGVA